MRMSRHPTHRASAEAIGTLIAPCGSERVMRERAVRSQRTKVMRHPAPRSPAEAVGALIASWGSERAVHGRAARSRWFAQTGKIQ